MSSFFSQKYRSLEPYVPGEQPQGQPFLKLNTNESCFPPSERVAQAAAQAARRLHLYPDPQCGALHRAFAKRVGVSEEEVLATNGSDEILNFAFMAFCDRETPAIFPKITYGFYSVFARLNGVPYEEVPLKEDFTVAVSDYERCGKTVFLANPNAPTGIALRLEEIERIVASNPDRVVVIDEAYIDFGGESCVPLIHRYDNLLVTQTFSKSRSMAGARLGFGIGCRELIRDLNIVKYSTNPYNINAMTMAAGLAMLEEEEATLAHCAEVAETRDRTANELKKLGFLLTDSSANFLFAKHPRIGGRQLYEQLKQQGILVRHFDLPDISEYNRITVGSREQMRRLTDTLSALVGENG